MLITLHRLRDTSSVLALILVQPYHNDLFAKLRVTCTGERGAGVSLNTPLFHKITQLKNKTR